ncbi:tyrosine-type recombinase/integrase [Marinobacter shengliensis]|uniref:tyrosine-type recombinase/integrase n=1 Tax=Marinobacter shengliensis TaxID=1389223 RepID=UPI001107B865|nr:site-specific integrase [Marinobacter shengliensis]
MSTRRFQGHPLFDTAANLQAQIDRPEDYPTLATFLQGCPKAAQEDWQAAALFLMRHTATAGTFAQFRGEVQRFLNYAWVIKRKSLKEIGGDDIDDYMALVKKPMASWATSKAQGRQRGFVSKAGARVANPKWRPFYDADSKRKAATMGVTVASLEIFFKKLVVSGYLAHSPMIDATRRAQKASKSEHAGKQKGMATSGKKRTTAPRLTAWQWSYILETLTKVADENPRYERNLFVVVTMKVLYLRVFELAPHGVEDTDNFVEPTMGDFARTTVGNSTYWELYVCGKGEKDRWIPLPDEYLEYLKRYRRYRGLQPLPTPGETSAMVTRVGSDTPIRHKRSIEGIVEESLSMVADRMERENLLDAAEELRQMAKKTHILRHTGASMDLEAGRPIRDVSEDLGHESAAFTEEVYIDADTAKRYQSGKIRRV